MADLTITARVRHCYSFSLWSVNTKAIFCPRSLTDAAGASPSKYSRQYVRIPVESGQAVSLPREIDSGWDGMVHSDLKVFLITYPNLITKCTPF